jgi:hypothetical protein
VTPFSYAHSRPTWQHAATELIRAGLIDTVMVFTPRTNLCTQAETNWWTRDAKTGQQSGRRLLYAEPVPHSFTWPDGNRTPLYEPPAQGYVTTNQALVTNPDVHIDHAERHSSRVLLVVDEAAALGGYGVGENDDREATLTAQRIAELIPHAAAVLYLTGAAHRGDGRMLIGLEHRYRRRDDGTHVLDADVTGTYTQGVSAGFLRPIEVTYVNSEGKEVLRDGLERVVSVAEDQSLVSDALLFPGVYESIARRTVGRLRALRAKHAGLMAGIACLNQDHARDVHHYLCAYAPDLRVQIAVSNDGPRSRAVLDRARVGQVDVLVFVRQAFIGFDCPPMAVLAILTNYRDDAFLMQLSGRVLRIWRELEVSEQWAHFITLNDRKAVQFFERLREDAQKGIREREPGDGPGPKDGVGRDIRDMRDVGAHVDDSEGIVDGGADALAVIERYRIWGKVRDVADMLRDVRDGKTNGAHGNDDPEPVATTVVERCAEWGRRTQRNAKAIAGAYKSRGDERPIDEIVRAIQEEISRKSYWARECKRDEAKAKARYTESVRRCGEEGTRVHERAH